MLTTMIGENSSSSTSSDVLITPTTDLVVDNEDDWVTAYEDSEDDGVLEH